MQKDKDYVVYTISLQGKVMYVGSTNNFNHRKWMHINQIGTQYSAIPTDVDVDKVTIQIVKVWKSKKAMLNSEGRMIKKYDTIKNGWNKVRGCLGISNKYEYWKEYNATRKDKIKEYQRRWVEKNREYLIEYQKQYRELKKIKTVG